MPSPLRWVGVTGFDYIAAEVLGQARHLVEELDRTELGGASDVDPNSRTDNDPVDLIDPVEDLDIETLPGELGDGKVPAVGVIEYELSLHPLFHERGAL